MRRPSSNRLAAVPVRALRRVVVCETKRRRMAGDGAACARPSVFVTLGAGWCAARESMQ
ncbi:hypothetical protein [Actinoplanes sp. NPDC049265]|uniref:hypothetical protein n=1 Tax=Actinoplanes sp. NPDC049265 TaxID=3363902 RepID=UPI0037212AFC